MHPHISLRPLGREIKLPFCLRHGMWWKPVAVPAQSLGNLIFKGEACITLYPIAVILD
jgi:hypothetical protein